MWDIDRKRMNKEEIQKELEQLPREWVVAFTSRVASQVLPKLLTKEDAVEPYFAFWPEEKRSAGLFTMLRANAYSSRTVFLEEFIVMWYEPLSPQATIYTFILAAVYISASVTSLDALKKSSKAFMREAIEVATYAQYAGINLSKELVFLKQEFSSQKRANGYLLHDLYFSQDKQWLEGGQKFVQVLKHYGSGFDLWADWFQGRIDGIPSNKEFLETVAHLPEEILAQEPKYINAYLKSLGNAAGALNRARVIFLGAGYAGKTSLVRALNDQEVIAGMEQETPGIDISTWQVPGTEITANFWDFGGQVMAHATHQFFFRSRCLYVLVLEGRSETNANEQAEYWLYHVKVYGGNAPVILVGNKDEDCPVNLDMARLKEKHDNVLGFYPLSCIQYQDEYADKFRSFKNDLIKEIEKLGVHQIRFSKAHLAVLDELTSLSGTESFLPKNDWLKLCADKGLAEHGDLNQAWLLDLFDKLGVIVHFPKLAALDSYILNPRWLTYGVYTLLYSKEAKEKKGRLQESEIIRILSEAEVRDHLGNILSYPQEKAWIVLKAMKEFDLSFPCRHEPDSIVIPALLDSDQPEHGFAKHDSLAFEFDFTGFLPRHIMPNFIVGRHDEIKGELVWQNGVVLQKQPKHTQHTIG
ncbi:MAG: hypothetical protein D3917_13165, partial [Candidatus Electrothrix sp. AX5]|nr:hypothetical protein [Candidatus Electrothrix sp. AX5]